MPVYVSDLLTATAAPVNAVPTATRTWQWLRGSTSISGATSSTYTAVADDIGATIAASQIETNVAGTATATSAPTEVIQAFDPIRLFSASEPGVWYDPNDISTLFKGPTPVAPVTTPGDSVYFMMDKSQGGPGPELVTNGTFDTNIDGWTVAATALFVWSNGAATYTRVAFGDRVSQAITCVVGRSYRITATLSNISGGTVRAGFNAALTTATEIANTTTAGTYSVLVYATATTMYLQFDGNANGTTFSIDNISVKELPGNHATQPTTASQPIYGIVPAGGRRNLFLQTEAFNEAVWIKAETTVPATQFLAPDGTTTAEALIPTTVSGQHYTYVSVTTAAAQYTISLYAKSNGYDFITLMDATVSQARTFNLSNGTKGGTASQLAPVSDDIVPVGGGWYRCSITVSATAAAQSLRIYAYSADNTAGWSGNGTSGILLWGAQLELGSTATPYQRVTTQYDVTEAGVASLGYLFFDGSGDFMSTGTITPGTDKAQVFSGVRKLSDATVGMLLEMGAALGNGAVNLVVPQSTLNGSIRSNSRGTATAVVNGPSQPAPASFVASVQSDISNDNLLLRIDGTLADQVTTDQGTGNFLAYPLYIGRRGGTTLPFQGHLFPLIVRFGPNLTAARISATESWVASKTPGVTL